MNKIIAYRTHICIFDYNLGDKPVIENTFSIYDMTYHKRFPKGMLYDKANKILYLPRGIDLDFLARVFNVEPVIDQTVAPYESIGNIMLKYKPRDNDQIEAINFMISGDKYASNRYYPMICVNLNTGKGKTYCAIATTAILGLRPIVITDSIGWLEQWKKFFLEYTDIQEDEIYLISGAPSFMKLFNRDPSKYKVILSTHSTLKSIGDNQGWNTISEFFNYCKIGIKFFDEAHLNFDNMFQIDCYTNAFLTYYLTATPGRSDLAENNIYRLYFKNVPSIDLFNRDRDPHTKYAAIRFNSNPTPIEASRCKNKYGLDRIAYTKYLVHNEQFKKLLYILIDKAIHKPGKSLIYIGTNEAIMDVRDLIYEMFPELINQVGIYTSVIPPELKQEQLEKKIILSTTKSAGAAMDIKGLTETINLAEPFKSRVLAQQTFGRTRADNTIYKDIVDDGFYYTRKFYDYKKPVFSKYATKCVEVNLNNNTLDEKYVEVEEARKKLIQPMTFLDGSIK